MSRSCNAGQCEKSTSGQRCETNQDCISGECRTNASGTKSCSCSDLGEPCRVRDDCCYPASAITCRNGVC